MKKIHFGYFVLAVILIIACNNPVKDVKENPYEGVWELIGRKIVYPDHTFDPIRPAFATVKILTKKHFAWGNQLGQDQIFGGGGEYTFDSDSYTEHVNYHTDSGLVGKYIEYKTTLEGGFWQITRVKMQGSIQVEEIETWKRVIE